MCIHVDDLKAKGRFRSFHPYYCSSILISTNLSKIFCILPYLAKILSTNILGLLEDSYKSGASNYELWDWVKDPFGPIACVHIYLRDKVRCAWGSRERDVHESGGHFLASLIIINRKLKIIISHYVGTITPNWFLVTLSMSYLWIPRDENPICMVSHLALS